MRQLRNSEGIIESLAFFAVGCALMTFMGAGPPGYEGRPAGVPGHDSYYHIKMATLLPEHGLVREFPWLKFVYFTPEGHDFVNHHYGFQVLLLPFVTIGRWITGDAIDGGRWAVAAFFGVTLMMYSLLLRSFGVRWRWLWLFFFFLMPFQFFSRHAYVRAIGPSVVCMMAIVLAINHRRHRLLGVVIAVYIHSYLGAVLYAPLLVGLYVLSCAIGPAGDRKIPWTLIAWSAAGWIVGVLTHPYAGGILDFLKLQVFGSGLTPDISVGREWKSYQGVWWFAQMSGNVLLLWMIALCLRIRLGPRLSVHELFLLLINFAFLFLTAKARRFIEYWPLFCLLSAAVLLAPLAATPADWFDRLWNPPRSPRKHFLPWTVLTFFLVSSAVLVAIVSRKTTIGGFTAEWPTWIALATICMLAPLMRVWLIASSAPAQGRIPASSKESRHDTIASGALGESETMSTGRRCLASAGILATGLTLLLAIVCFASEGILEVQRIARRPFDLTAVKDAMTFLKEVSNPGDVVFTDDWDVFPVYFCFNSHNHYVVGLDPKFTQARRPVLWKRYVKISRGQVPTDITVTSLDDSGKPTTEQLHVALEDIRDHFGARFVITDHDHQPLARKLARADDFAELIYPSPSYDSARDAPFLIFRIRDAQEAAKTTDAS